MADNKIYEKLEKILAKTRPGSNASDHEIELALKMANKIMAENNISMMDLDEFGKTEKLGKLGVENQFEAKKWYNWEQGLANSIAKFFNCKVVSQKPRGEKKSSLIFVGREANMRTAILMFKWLDDDCLIKAKKYKKGHPGEWLSYCTGFVVTVQNKVNAEIEARKAAEVTSNEKGLVVVDEVDQFMRDFFKNLTDKTNKLSYSKGEAYREGCENGEKVSLNNQIGLKGLEYKSA